MQKPYSQSLLTYGRNKLFWQLGHTVTRVCQRSLHFHESFISYFSFLKKSCMKLICYWFETYYLLQLLQRVVSRRQYCSVHICVFQCHHGIRETFPEKPKKSWGNFKGLHWLFPTVSNNLIGNFFRSYWFKLFFSATKFVNVNITCQRVHHRLYYIRYFMHSIRLIVTVKLIIRYFQKAIGTFLTIFF